MERKDINSAVMGAEIRVGQARAGLREIQEDRGAGWYGENEHKEMILTRIDMLEARLGAIEDDLAKLYLEI